MKQQSSALLQLVARFKLGEAQAEPAPQRPQAPKPKLMAATSPRMALAGQSGWQEF
jgi:hypothetical protein